jgi:hypothetical protein
MRHWLIVLLLAVVPLQLAWAGAAVYCGHESAVAAAQHVGHHEHVHQPSTVSDSAPADDADMSSAFHADCETCHFGVSATLTMAPLRTAVQPSAGLLGASLPRYSSHIPAGPERPDRPLLPLPRDATAALRSSC